jgi:hypothetical protein
MIFGVFIDITLGIGNLAICLNPFLSLKQKLQLDCFEPFLCFLAEFTD